MDARWRQIERLYHAAREREKSARAAFVAKACAGDDGLRREVESLLVQTSRQEVFLAAPVVKTAARGFGKVSASRLPRARPVVALSSRLSYLDRP